jgi:hypothetical protein
MPQPPATTIPQPPATAVPQPPAQSTSTAGDTLVTLLGLLLVLALCCAVTGIIVWLIASRRGQPPVTRPPEAQPPATTPTTPPPTPA